MSEDSISVIINQAFQKEEDVISKRLLTEARKINKFIESDEIAWSIDSITTEKSEEILSKIESISMELWVAISNLLIKDKDCTYDDTIVKIVSYMSRIIQSPSGTSFQEGCKCIRYYPLYVLISLISIICVAEKRDKLLMKVLKLQLSNVKSYYDEPLPITYLPFLIRRSDWLFDPIYSQYPNSKWCDPIASYTQLLLGRILSSDEILWDTEKEYYIGEFVLSLAPMDILDKDTDQPLFEHPAPGLFIYVSSSAPIIIRFLKNESDWLQKIYKRPLKELLTEFDQKAKGLAARSCFHMGFTDGAVNAAFPEKRTEN